MERSKYSLWLVNYVRRRRTDVCGGQDDTITGRYLYVLFRRQELKATKNSMRIDSRI